ncbi:MAG: 3'-phosphoesterase [Nanoarchaeota archaeon]|nr:3'-phosphoesterase [Nanoarchaeota archaeon]
MNEKENKDQLPTGLRRQKKELKEYIEKRDFSKTKEPKSGKQSTIDGKQIYCIQKHNASHLHWDLRLEFDGVLKSWAIPKEPPRIKGIKRLAIQTEDHPLNYANFEGEIPEGQYGGGKVEIWDKGIFTLVERKKDIIVIDIKAKKLNGEYCLIKTNYGSKPEKKLVILQKIRLISNISLISNRPFNFTKPI